MGHTTEDKGAFILQRRWRIFDMRSHITAICLQSYRDPSSSPPVLPSRNQWGAGTLHSTQRGSGAGTAYHWRKSPNLDSNSEVGMKIRWTVNSHGKIMARIRLDSSQAYLAFVSFSLFFFNSIKQNSYMKQRHSMGFNKTAPIYPL